MDVSLDSGAAPVLAAGRFEVRGTLGAGGAGVVYRAFDRQLKREVALKLLRQASGRDLYRFKREFRALAGIVHPNLVALHELHSVDGDWYFTMELVEGMSWLDWVRPGPQPRTRAAIGNAQFDAQRLRASLVQLVDALIALHDAGKLHRDLKPSNVLVDAQGRVTLLDFGLVTTLLEGNPDRLAVGTPVYMSPEQASDQPLGPASDFYSVGAMLYEALTGRRPFEGGSEQVMTRKQTEHPTEPVVSVPADLSRLCMTLLAPSPAARPTGHAVLAQLGAAPSRRTLDLAKQAARQAFVGRKHELDQLAGALGDAHRQAVAILVRGRSGIGKSTLIKHFLTTLGDAVFVLEGRCFEREAVPFKMLDGLVDTLTAVVLGLSVEQQAVIAPKELGSLVRLFPVLRRVPKFAELAGASTPPVDLQELRRRGFQALRAVLARLAREKPVVMFVDDAHWGDADSAGFLAELIHGAEPQTLIIIAHRPEDYLGVVAQLKRAPAASSRRGELRELDVSPLSKDDASALVAAIADDIDRTQQVVEAAAGNPLVLTEMARGTEGAQTIEALVRARVARLPVEMQAMLAVSSIAARPIPIAIAARAAGIVGGHDEAARLSAERLATLREVGDDMILHPAHDYVRAAILASLDLEAKASWHEALARAFEDVQGADKLDSQAVVEHWLAAGHPENAAHHAVTAAQQAEEALAFHRAAELYQIALTYGPWDTTGQRDLLRRKAQALTCAGQLDEAAAVYGHAAHLLADAEAIDLERLRVEALLRRGRLDEALPAAEKLLAQIGVRVPIGMRTSRTRMATQWMQAKFRGLEFVERDPAEISGDELLAVDVLYSIASGLAFADPALGRVVQSELIRAALDAGEPIRVCLALGQELCYAAAAGHRNRGAVVAVGTRLRAVAKRVGHPHVIGFADLSIGLAAHMHGRWTDALADLEMGLERLREHAVGVRWEIDIGEAYWLATLFYLGEWRALARLAQLHLRDAIDRGDIVAQQGLRTGRTNLAWLVLDRPDDARAQLDAVDKTLGPGFHVMHAQTAIAAAHVDLYRGDVAAASARLAQAVPQLERIGFMRFQQPRVELDYLRVRLALARGDRDAGAIADGLIAEGVTWAVGLGQLARAALHAFDGDVDRSLDALQLAEDLFAAAKMSGHVQIVRMRRGGLEGGANAIARSEAARDALRDLGAVDPDRFSALLMPWPD